MLNVKKVWERCSHALPCHYTPAYTHNMWREQAKIYTHIYATQGRTQGGDWGDRPPETYESNFTPHDFVQFRKQHSRLKAILSSIVLS